MSRRSIVQLMIEYAKDSDNDPRNWLYAVAADGSAWVRPSNNLDPQSPWGPVPELPDFKEDRV